jgi:hypothetical protein
MELTKLLAGQRRTKVGVPFANDGERWISQLRRQLVVSRSATLTGDQPNHTFSAIPVYQPLHLASRQAQSGRCDHRLQIAFNDSLNRLESVNLAHAHRNHLGSGHDATPGDLELYSMTHWAN